MSSNLLRKYSVILEGMDDSELFGTPTADSPIAKKNAKLKKMVSAAKDVRGVDIQEGDTVVRAVSLNRGGSAGLEIRQVTKVVGGFVYLDGSSTPMKFPERLAVLGR
jgi:uncharacterized Zn ribbon protein